MNNYRNNNESITLHVISNDSPADRESDRFHDSTEQQQIDDIACDVTP